jgi:uncharacterized membrane protein YuzA (DUF378 family)
MHNLRKNEKNNIRGENMIIAQKIALAFTILGAIVWGLIGIFDFNLVEFLFQEGSFLTRAIYIIVCLCGLFNIGLFFIKCRDCNMEDF